MNADTMTRQRAAAIRTEAVEANLKWGVTEATATAVRAALVAAVEAATDRHTVTGCTCDMRGDDCAKVYEDALHDFDTGCYDLTLIAAAEAVS